jgi:hypothetical protein
MEGLRDDDGYDGPLKAGFGDGVLGQPSLLPRHGRSFGLDRLPNRTALAAPDPSALLFSFGLLRCFAQIPQASPTLY